MAERRSARLTPSTQPGAPGSSKVAPTQPGALGSSKVVPTQPGAPGLSKPAPTQPGPPPNIQQGFTRLDKGVTRPSPLTVTPDISTLRQPILLGTEGVPQILQCMKSATQEITDILLYECNIVYECKVCLSLFRGLTNLIAHKRTYCQHCHNDTKLNFINPKPDDETVIIEAEAPPPDPEPVSEWDNYIDSDVESLVYIPPRSSTPTVIKQLQQGTFKGTSDAYKFYTKAVERTERQAEDRAMTTVKLTPISTTKVAMYQQIESDEISKSQKVSIDGHKENNIKKPDDKNKRSCVEKHLDKSAAAKVSVPSTSSTIMKLHRFKQVDIGRLMCLKCAKKLSSRRSLLRHMMSLHALKKVMCSCPVCKKPMTRVTNVLRHLKTVHGKTNEQVEKLRCKVMSKKNSIEVTNDLNDSILQTDTDDEEMSGDSLLTSGDSIQQETKPVMSKQSQSKTVKTKGSSLGSLCRCDRCGKMFGKKGFLERHKKLCKTGKKTVYVKGINKNKATKAGGITKQDKNDRNTKTVDKVSKVSVDKVTKTPVEKATKTPVEKAMKTPVEKAIKTPFEKAIKTPVEKATKTSVEKATKPPVEKAIKSPPTGDKLTTKEKTLNVKSNSSKDKSSNIKDSPTVKSGVTTKTNTKQNPMHKQQTIIKFTKVKDVSVEKQEKSNKPSSPGTGKTVKSGADGGGKTVKSGADGGGKTVKSGADGGGKTVKSGADGGGKTVKSGADGGGKTVKSGADGGKTVKSGADVGGKTVKSGVDGGGKTVKSGADVGGKTVKSGADGGGKAAKSGADGGGKAAKSGADIKGKIVKSTADNSTGDSKNVNSIDVSSSSNKAVEHEKIRRGTTIENVFEKFQRSVSEESKDVVNGKMHEKSPRKESPQQHQKNTNSPINNKCSSPQHHQIKNSPKKVSDSNKHTRSQSQGNVEVHKVGESKSRASLPMVQFKSQRIRLLKSKEEVDETSDDCSSALGKRKRKEDLVVMDVPEEINTKYRRTESTGQEAQDSKNNDSVANDSQQPTTQNTCTSTSDNEPKIQIRVIGSKSQSKVKSKVITVKESCNQPSSSKVVTVKYNSPGQLITVKQSEKYNVNPTLHGLSRQDRNKVSSLVDEDTLTCLKCGNKYGSSSNLHRHAVRHLGWRRFKCILCNFTFFNKSECRRHIKMIHARKMAEKDLNPDDYIQELEADKIKTQTISMPRVEIPKNFHNIEHPNYNISTRKTARRFDTSPFVRPDESSTLCTRSGEYKKVSIQSRNRSFSESSVGNTTTKSMKFYPQIVTREETIEQHPTEHIEKTVIGDVIVKPAFTVDNTVSCGKLPYVVEKSHKHLYNSKSTASPVRVLHEKPVLLQRKRTSSCQSLAEKLSRVAMQPTIQLQRVDYKPSATQGVNVDLKQQPYLSLQRANVQLQEQQLEPRREIKMEHEPYVSLQKANIELQQPQGVNVRMVQQPNVELEQHSFFNLQGANIAMEEQPKVNIELDGQVCLPVESSNNDILQLQQTSTLYSPAGDIVLLVVDDERVKGQPTVLTDVSSHQVIDQSSLLTYMGPRKVKGQPNALPEVSTDSIPVHSTLQHNEVSMPSQHIEVSMPSQHIEVSMPSQHMPSQHIEVGMPSQHNEVSMPSQHIEVGMPSQLINPQNFTLQSDVKIETENSNQSSCVSNPEMSMTTEQVSFATGDDLLQMIDEDQRQSNEDILETIKTSGSN